MQQTNVNSKWLFKIVIFLVALTGLGIWGLYDATLAYPRRGQAVAQWALYEYLGAARESGDLIRAGVADPRAEYDRLRPIRRDLETRAAGDSLAARRAATELKLLDWLDALAVIGRLDAENTRLERPSELLDELSLALAGETPPKRLAAWDIPIQWAFVVAGFGGGAWLGLLILMVRSRRYTFDPETRTLTLPGGRAVTPADLVELDKRKWDKFIVTLRTKAGDPVRLDLLRYTPLEEWVLDMEKAAGLSEDSKPADSSAKQPASAAPAGAASEASRD